MTLKIYKKKFLNFKIKKKYYSNRLKNIRHNIKH